MALLTIQERIAKAKAAIAVAEARKRIAAAKAKPAPVVTPAPPPGSPAAKVELAKVKEEELPEVDTRQLKEDELREERRRLGIKPTPSELSERGQVLIPQPEEPSDVFAVTQVSDILLERGVGRPPPSPPPLTQPERIERAEMEARERIAEQRGRVGFERRFQPIAQTVTQKKYDELMAKKASELGMVWDAGQGAWIGNESQIERFREYEPEAQVQSMTFGTDYYQTQWEQIGLGGHAEEIYREEFAEEGFELIEKPDGTFTVITKAEFKKQKRIGIEKERIRARMTGTPEERVAQLALFVSSAFIKPFSETGLLGVTGEALFGGEDKAEVILGKLARESVEFQGISAPELFAKSFIDTEGFGFTAAFAVATTVGIGGLLGKVGGAGGRILQKGIPIVVRGALVTTIGAELGVTAAMEGKAEAGKLALRRFGQIAAFETFGALATGRPILPKAQREIIFDPETGVITQQRFFDVFGKQLRLPGVKQAQILVGDTITPAPSRALGLPSGRVPLLPGISTTFPGAKPTTVVDITKAVTTISQVRGIQKITYNVATGSFVVKKIDVKMKPFDTKFKPPVSTVKSPEEIIASKFEVDLFKKAETVLIQKKITDVVKGKFLIGEDTVKLEKFPVLKGTKPFLKPVKPEPRPLVDLKKWEVTKADIKKYDAIQEAAYKKFGEQRLFRLKDLLKQPPVQTKLFQKDILIGTKPFLKPVKPEPRPLVDLKKWEVTKADIKKYDAIQESYEKKLREWKPKFLEDVKPKAVVTTQTTLDKLFKLPSFELVKGVITKQPPSKPFRYKPIKEEKIITSKTDKTVTILKKIDVKTSVRDLDMEFVSKKPSGITEDALRKLGRFEPDEFVRMIHPKAPKGVVKPTDRIELLAAPIVSRILKTDMSQVKAVGELSGRLTLTGQANILEKAMSRITDTQQRNELKMSQGILQSSLNIQDVISGERQGQTQVQTQVQMQRQALRTTTVLTTVSETVFEEPTVTVTPPVGILGLQAGLMKGVSLQPQAYDVYTYKTQFKDGRRIRGKVLDKINKKPLRRTDALALGSNVVDNNAKRTIILKPTEGKPTKLKRKVPSWMSRMFEYNDKGNDRWVEKNTHAIDSPGELREITMKGIAARKRGVRRSNNGLPGGINNLDVRMSRRLIV